MMPKGNVVLDTSTAAAGESKHKERSRLFFVIASASIGTLVEFYDLILAIVLAPVLSRHLFPPGEVRFLETLAIIATSYFVRPVGALIFGKIGDSRGRRKPFLFSLLLMGSATFLIGCIPKFETIGWFAPLLLLLLRLLQGLAISGEYTAAAIYVGEHVPQQRRGFYTGFVQATIPLSLLFCLSIFFITQQAMTKEAFGDYGWRFPFLFSIVLVVFGYFIRRKLEETPRYMRLQGEGSVSRQPVRESFQASGNIRSMLLVIFGGCAAQSTLMQTTHFVILFYLQRTISLSLDATLLVMGAATLIGCPFFQLFGALSDKIGRKKVILPGLILSVVLLPLMFHLILEQGNPARLHTVHAVDGLTIIKLILCIASLHICCAMVYGPLAAFILESFPTRIRFTSMGFVYNIGNGVLGGSTTFISELLRSMIGLGVAFSFLTGLLYPLFLIVAAIIINIFFVPETFKRIL